MKASPANAVKPSTVFLGYAIDVIAPMAAFFVLNKLGVPAIWGLLLGSAIALGSTTINTVRRGHLDRQKRRSRQRQLGRNPRSLHFVSFRRKLG